MSSSCSKSSQGLLVRPTAVLAPVVAKDGPDLHTLLLEEGQYVVVEDLDGGHGHLRGLKPGTDVAAEAVEHGLDLVDALEGAREEGVHGHKLALGMNFDVALAEFGVEAARAPGSVPRPPPAPCRTPPLGSAATGASNRLNRIAKSAPLGRVLLGGWNPLRLTAIRKTHIIR